MTLNIAGIPPYAKMREPIDAIAEWNGGLLNSLKSGFHSTFRGAAAGWSCTPTATVKVRAEVSAIYGYLDGRAYWRLGYWPFRSMRAMRSCSKSVYSLARTRQ